MDERWRHQLRIYIPDDLAEMARAGTAVEALRPLFAILDRHRATPVSQLDAFLDYVTEAEREGPAAFPLYRWTKATVDDPAKRARHVGTFALRIDGAEVYGAAAADALEADLRPLVGGPVVPRMSRHDTDPANSMPVPPQYRG